jgi:hypothetical protein
MKLRNSLSTEFEITSIPNLDSDEVLTSAPVNLLVAIDTMLTVRDANKSREDQKPSSFYT